MKNSISTGKLSIAAAVIALSLFTAPLPGFSDSDPLKDAWKLLPAAEKQYRRGLEEFRAGRYPDAATAFRKCAETLPRHAYARYYLANIAYLKNDYQEALTQMEDCLKDLDFMRVLNAYAVEQKNQTIASFQQMLDTQWENAPNCRAQREIESLSDEISTQKNKMEIRESAERNAQALQDAHYRYFLGNIRFQLKQFPEALAAYQEALALNPRHASAANNAAAIHHFGGDSVGALAILEKAEDQGLGDNINLKLKYLVFEALGRPTAGILEEDLSPGSEGDLGVMRFALAYKFENPLLPPLYENCYVVFHRATREAVLIDPGVEDPRIAGLVAKNGLEVKAVLNTHNHPDHTAANAYYANLFKAPVLVPRPDAKSPADPQERAIEDGEAMAFDGFTVRTLLTPGHTPGSACYMIGGYLFSGDTLFRNDIGMVAAEAARHAADVQGRLVRVIREKIMVLPAETRVCPGHGKTTTIAEEAANNPFLNK